MSSKGSAGWPNGSTARWRKIRKFVLERDGYRCQLKIEGKCKIIADSVHHVRGARYGDDPADLVAACMPCNQSVGNPERTVPDPEPRPRTAW